MNNKRVRKETEIRLSPEVKERLEEFISRCEYYKNSYFWTPPLSSSTRRYREEKDSIKIFEFKVNEDTYAIEFEVSMSCKNVYAKSYIYKNGVKTTLTVIKTLLKKDKGIAEVADITDYQVVNTENQIDISVCRSAV